jgi:AmmeMemoRadiSam system protein A
MLNAHEQRELIDVAWKSIRHRVCGAAGENDERESDRLQSDSALRQPAGAFVTLSKKGNLRGCLGLIASDAPLLDTVKGIAARAATEDPRFPRVTEDELGDIRIEVSILSPLREISSIEEIHVGTHGLFIHAGMFRGLLLPQVAVTQHWDRNQFLEETCVKAGLPRDHWKHSETRIYVFSAEIIRQEV